jgi:glycosyltransferase involved in cell wall biosynthesis
MTEPLITIITVTYNAASVLRETIQSVLNQTYSNIEYIIIDGGSTDETLDILKEYSTHLTFWKSEPDKGIYDAMNKGVSFAKGEWVNFMNAGDLFYDKDVIRKIFSSTLLEDYSVVYGKTLVSFPYGKYIVTPSHLSRISKQMPFCHQSSFVKTRLLRETLFDIRCKIAADYNFFYKLYAKDSSSFCYYNDVIAVYDAIQGVSSVEDVGLLKEMENISDKHLLFRSKAKKKIIGYFPFSFVKLVYEIYYFFNKRYEKYS